MLCQAEENCKVQQVRSLEISQYAPPTRLKLKWALKGDHLMFLTLTLAFSWTQFKQGLPLHNIRN